MNTTFPLIMQGLALLAMLCATIFTIAANAKVDSSWNEYHQNVRKYFKGNAGVTTEPVAPKSPGQGLRLLVTLFMLGMLMFSCLGIFTTGGIQVLPVEASPTAFVVTPAVSLTPFYPPTRTPVVVTPTQPNGCDVFISPTDVQLSKGKVPLKNVDAIVTQDAGVFIQAVIQKDCSIRIYVDYGITRLEAGRQSKIFVDGQGRQNIVSLYVSTQGKDKNGNYPLTTTLGNNACSLAYWLLDANQTNTKPVAIVWDGKEFALPTLCEDVPNFTSPDAVTPVAP